MQKPRLLPGFPSLLVAAGVYGNRTHWGRCSHPPLVLKTRAGTSRANTPEGGPTHCKAARARKLVCPRSGRVCRVPVRWLSGPAAIPQVTRIEHVIHAEPGFGPGSPPPDSIG